MTEPHDPPILQSPPGARVVVDGAEYDYFGGTAYLGLQGHPEVIAAATQAMQRLGVHSATSRTRYASQPVLDVEAAAAGFFDTQAAYYFASGYLANWILCQAYASDADAIFLDEFAHYSVGEAAHWSRLSGPVVRFANRDPRDLRRHIEETDSRRPMVLTDGVFPSFGWIAPLDRYVEVLADLDAAVLLVDDAHGFGVLGEHGRGTLEHFGLFERANQHDVDGVRLLVGGTASKALGGHGGLIPGERAFLDRLHRSAHVFDGASAPPAAIAAATATAIQLARDNPDLRRRLRTNTQRLRDGLRVLGFSLDDLPTPILGFVHGDRAAMLALQQALAGDGILLPYAGTYSGVGDAGAMRLAVCATHTDAQIDRLLDALRRHAG